MWEGVIGGLTGALFTLIFTELNRSANERSTAIVAVATELTHNLSLACDVLENNVGELADPAKCKWWEIVGFSNASWEGIINSGALARLKPEVTERLARAYESLHKADFGAVKMQIGKVDPEKAKYYTIDVYDAAGDTHSALKCLGSQTEWHYERNLNFVKQLTDTIETWEEKRKIWKEEVDANRRANN